jgi:hypothetical protein
MPFDEQRQFGPPTAHEFRGRHTEFLPGPGQTCSPLLWPDWRVSLDLVCRITSLSGETAGNK